MADDDTGCRREVTGRRQATARCAAAPGAAGRLSSDMERRRMIQISDLMIAHPEITSFRAA